MSILCRVTHALVPALLLVALPAAAQEPLTNFTDAFQVRSGAGVPDLAYTLQVDSTDLSGFNVELELGGAPDTFRLAMVVHPEYDDRFYRHLEGLSATGAGDGPVEIVREDSTLWRVTRCGGQCRVRYRIAVPAHEGIRSGWVPFLAPTGGLIGGPHAFLYVVGATLAPARVRLVLPAGWAVATGLEPTADPMAFYAASAFVLVDSPILVGRLRSWSFEAGGAPHRVVYWPLPDAVPFDTTALVDGVRAVAEQAIRLFGRAPYREYLFLLQDGAQGSLEHLNSVTLGAPSRALAENPGSVLPELAHEFFHTWNLVRIRPTEYSDVDYRKPPRSRGLWWSEGVTILYADLLRRRAGLPTFEPTRLAHLEGLLRRYHANPAYGRFSAESVSVVEYGTEPGALGDYRASTHLQGEVLGTLIDLLVRDATDGRRTLDDVIRLMLARFSGRKGFTRSGVESVVHEVCGCPVRGFFDRYVATGHPIDFAPYLRQMGLRLDLTWAPAANDSGVIMPDRNVGAWEPDGERGLRFIIVTPDGVWGRAGLHTGDQIVSLNGAPVADWEAFRTLRNGLKIGDTVRVEIRRPAGTRMIPVMISGYRQPVARLVELPDATVKARRLLDAWKEGR